jgi:hypothetical protein
MPLLPQAQALAITSDSRGYLFCRGWANYEKRVTDNIEIEVFFAIGLVTVFAGHLNGLHRKSFGFQGVNKDLGIRHGEKQDFLCVASFARLLT